MERRVIAIVGPTASGKSELGFLIAKKLNTEIISADSRQVYKELNIGTAKPPEIYLNEIRHHFINRISITGSYDVGRFVKEATEIINQLHQENKIPVIVGGSGLYINSLLYGIFEGPSADETVRKNFEYRLNTQGISSLLDELSQIDPATFEKIDKNNPRRIIRSLEVYYLTGKQISQLHLEKHKTPDYEKFLFALDWYRNELYERINKRADMMIENGLIDEVRFILKNYGESVNVVLQTVGYKEIISYLKNEITLEKAIELIKRNTRRYAKRQLTWFRKDKNINWLKVNSSTNFEEIVDSIIKFISGGKE